MEPGEQLVATPACGEVAAVARRLQLRRIGAGRWCAIDPRYPSDDARCLVGYVERADHVFHAIRLDSSPVLSYDEPDLQSVLDHFRLPPVVAL